jgi:DNA-binding LacI/PurR family transcriptional regulator
VKRQGNARVAIYDVAKRAGVSTQTVSNYLNNRWHEMRPETRRRVARAVSELDYHPNATARGLRSAKTRTLAFLVLDEHARFLADPLTDLILAGVGDVATDFGYSILVHAAKPANDRLEDRFFTPILEGRVEGAFLLLSGQPDVRTRCVQRLATLNVPFVVFDELVEPPGISVRADDESGGRLLAEHLLSKGHRRIAFAAARAPWPVVEHRFKGYLTAMRRAGLEPPPEHQMFEATWEASSGVEIGSKLLSLDNPPTAIMCASDLLALGVIRAVRRAGLRIPEDVAITGFDDFEFSAYVDPPLTTVRVPAYELGRRAASIIIARLGGDLLTPRDHMLPVELCVRSSA